MKPIQKIQWQWLLVFLCFVGICVIACISHKMHTPEDEKAEDKVIDNDVELVTLEDSVHYFEDGL